MGVNGASYSSPADGYYYPGSTTYGFGTAMSSYYAMYNGTASSIAVTGLTGATTYKVYYYEVNTGLQPTSSSYAYNTRNYYSCGSYTFNTTNANPTLSAINNYTVCQDIATQTVSLTGIADGSSNESQSLTVTASSSNTTLVPTPTVSYTSPNSTGTLSYKPNAGQSGTAVITVTVNDGWTVNNTTTRTFTVTVLPKPGAAGAISGSSPICAGLTAQNYSIAATSNTTGYTWLMPAGFTVTAGAGTNNITVSTTTASTSGTMTVYATNANGCGNGISGTRAIQVDAQPATPNAGPDQPVICGTNAALAATAVTSPDAGAWTWLSGTPAPTPTASAINSISISGLGGPNTVYKYIWTVTRAGSVCPAKQDTVTLTTDWANGACAPASAFAYSPTSDVASNKVCVNTQLNFSDLSISANQWSWDFDYNGVPNYTSSLQNPSYTYTSTGTYTVYLRIWSNATSSYYYSQQTINVIDAPATPGTIFGTSNGICQGSSSQYVYSTGTVTDATGYNWTTPTGVNIDAYPSPTSIATSFSTNAQSGVISVSASNSCGTSGTSTLAVTVNPLPNSNGNPISGSASVCQGQNGVSFNMSGYSNASSYTWADLDGSQATGTSTYTTNIPVTASSGNILVWGTNSCGDGDTVSLAVSVNPLPGAASGTNGMNTVGICPNPGNVAYNTNAIANATSYIWTLPAGVTMAGGNGADSIQVNYSNNMNGGVYYIQVHGSNACGTGTPDSVAVVLNTPTPPQICMVTVDDSSTHNVIYWDKTTILFADSFRIYREDVTNVYSHIGTVHYNALSEFHDYDSIANPNVTTKRYKISSADSCGNESALSPYHNTIYIVDNGSGQFSWNLLYTIENGSNPVNNYELWVDSLNNGNWVQRASTAGTQQNINDIYYNNYSTVANWRVETAWNITCTPTNKLTGGNGTQATIVKSKSNITNNRNIGIRNNDANRFVVYPNPTDGLIRLNLAAPQGRVTVKISTLLGQELMSNILANGTLVHTLDLSSFESGTYVIQVITDKGISTQRVIKQ
jgi:hypothetical protein